MMTPEILELLRKPAVTPAEAGRILEMKRQATYEAIQRGDIQSFRIGKLIKVPTVHLRKKLGLADDSVAA
ncbi:MAG TPA: DNA-binding protein [Xanthobacteraceae bacterium]|nr:DNA-binding protein [Xanthobacteraceae bacterium]